MDANALMLFVEVVDAGSFAEAARRTGTPKSTLSRKLSALEDELGVRLIQRTSRRLGLTDAGRRLLAHARDMVATVAQAKQDVRAAGGDPGGRLRVTSSVSLGERLIGAPLMEFLAAHPGVALELLLDAAETDLIEAEIDVAIRIGVPDPKSPTIARRLAEARLYLCASPRYLEARGRPETLEALRDHDGLLYRRTADQPTFTLESADGVVRRVSPRARLLVNSHVVAASAAIAGLGVAALPAPFCRAELADGRLERVLPALQSPARWVYAAFPSRSLSAAARAFVELVAERIDPDTFLLAD